MLSSTDPDLKRTTVISGHQPLPCSSCWVSLTYLAFFLSLVKAGGVSQLLSDWSTLCKQVFWFYFSYSTWTHRFISVQCTILKTHQCSAWPQNASLPLKSRRTVYSLWEAIGWDWGAAVKLPAGARWEKAASEHPHRNVYEPEPWGGSPQGPVGKVLKMFLNLASDLD